MTLIATEDISTEATEAADALLKADPKWKPERVTKTELAGTPRDLDAILNGPRWLASKLCKSLGVVQ